MDNDFLGALQRAHATSATSARALSDLPAVPAEWITVFLAAGLIAEAAPGTFYLRPNGPAAIPLKSSSTPFTPLRVALMIAVWLVIVAIPVIAWMR